MTLLRNLEIKNGILITSFGSTSSAAEFNVFQLLNFGFIVKMSQRGGANQDARDEFQLFIFKR
jgi:hypothetical protein